jgi:hypothetical protein
VGNVEAAAPIKNTGVLLQNPIYEGAISKNGHREKWLNQSLTPNLNRNV